jgi:RNA polymerase primary sigma factor
VKLEQEFGRDPSAEEISEVVDLSYNQVKDVLRINNRPVSMDAPFDSNEESHTLLDVMINTDIPSTDAGLLDESLTNDINRSLSILTKREAEVIRMFYGIGTKISLSLDEISVELGLTRERVRQIKESGLRKLKHHAKNKLLRSYM